jgi:hypothetical protein
LNNAHVVNGITTQDAAIHHFGDACFDGRNHVLRNRADDLMGEDHT